MASGPRQAVTRFDPSNPDAQRTVALPSQPTALAASTGAVWVATQTGSMDRIDTKTLRVKPVGQLGPPLSALVASDTRLWATTLALASQHRGGTLRVAAGAPLDSIDPATSFTQWGWNILGLTNDGLVAFRRVGGAAGSLLVPDLATAIPSPTDGGRTYRFVLRSGVRYSSGQPVRASDVTRALRRSIAAKAGPASNFLSSIVGAARCRAAACDLSHGVVADDAAGTVTFHLTRADPDLPTLLALPFSYPVPAGIGPVRKERPVPATGPYRIASVSLDKKVVLERNPRFGVWSQQAKPDGFPARIVWQFGTSAARQISGTESGAVDVAFGPLLPAASLLRIPGQVHVHARAGVGGFFMNTRVAPFDDVRVRRAVNYAVDRRRVIDTFLGPDAAVVTCQILPPTIAGFRPYCPYGRGDVPASGYKGPDLVAARRLVQTSGTAGARITVIASVETKRLSDYLVGVLRSIGYQAHARVVGAFPKYFPYILDSRNNAQIGFYAWDADFLAPSDFLDLLFNCHSSTPANPLASFNPSRFCDPRVEHALAVARRVESTDETRAPLAWARVDRLITDLAPWVPSFAPRAVYAVSKRVGNYQFHPEWGPLVDQLWVK